MNEHSAKVMSKIADRSAGWAVLAIFLHRLPLIISAVVGTAGAASIIRFSM